MTTVFAYHRVADYDFWRAGYARAIAATPEVQSYRIWRGQDDPNYVITAENFDSREVDSRTTKLYDRRQDEISLDEIERIAI